MTPCLQYTLEEMAAASCGCLFERDAGDAADGLEEAVTLGYARGPLQHVAGTYYEITPRGRAALARASGRRAA